ncbi:hypothetical protein GCM10010313_73220 [Streptomyces violarus]|uniref:Putative membrane protein n=1 Tax=Streptomyces violarus TaxID=67380 RepID=A0A7W4ZXX5_9ACTN|nr:MULTISPECIES: DUF4190 domain-containing protein [Streptomyces]MBB3080466.1 putative membrane protein [Streptomyces violarus]WRT98306.1 DUF4190 domain-containing protein [Streptomyces sp. CGMCC 4.1772]GHD30519.1 hypothetical protein GCM10010313_73220 [Streptomyces violarus]
MTDATQPDGAGHDPWAPPEHKTSLDKNQTPQPPSVHDQATVTSMPSVGFTPPTGTPQYDTSGTGAVPPPPAAPGGYGYPGYPQSGGYGWPGMPPAPQNGMGIAAMVLGIVSCTLFCLYGIVSLVTGILAVVFGIKGRKRAEAGVATNHGQAQAGLIMGIIGIILGITVIVLIAVGITAAINSDTSSDDDPYYGAHGPVATAPSHR